MNMTVRKISTDRTNDLFTNFWSFEKKLEIGPQLKGSSEVTACETDRESKAKTLCFKYNCRLNLQQFSDDLKLLFWENWKFRFIWFCKQFDHPSENQGSRDQISLAVF